jgi:hypothetical protein
MASEEFKLDEETEAKIKEGMKYIEKFADRPFEERAQILTKFLEARGIKVERDKTFGDVLVSTPEGWGVMVLFNEAARIREGDVVWK